MLGDKRILGLSFNILSSSYFHTEQIYLRQLLKEKKTIVFIEFNNYLFSFQYILKVYLLGMKIKKGRVLFI